MDIRKNITVFLSVASFFAMLALIPLFVSGCEGTLRLIAGILGDGETRWRDALPLIILVGMLGCFGVMLYGGIRLLKGVVEPLRRMTDFANHLASGETPKPLKGNLREIDEIASLRASLNFLRDYQQNLHNKFKASIMRESEIRHEIERHDSRQVRILAGMLPELRQPLSVIKGLALVLKQMNESAKEPSAEQLRALDAIIKRVGLLSRRVDRMDDIASLSRERWGTLRTESFNTAEFLRELKERNRLTLQARELMLINRGSVSAPIGLRTDRELLGQLLSIMIRVVGRASSPGETIQVSCYTDQHRVFFEVRDSHFQVCREDLVRTYRLLHQSDDQGALCPTSESIGVLGIHLVGDIAKRIGSHLEVLSSEDANVILRLEFDEKDIATDFAEVRSNWCSSETQVLAETAKPGRILVGCDNADEAFILERILSAEHLAVDMVQSSKALLEKAKQECYDGFVLTSAIANQDPVELITHLRQAVQREVPIVLVVPQLSEEQFRQLFEIGGVWGMSYPLNYALLAKVLHRGGSASTARDRS